MSKNEFSFVLFEPDCVGWENGLEKAVEDSISLGVPLLVKSRIIYNRVKKTYPDLQIILKENL